MRALGFSVALAVAATACGGGQSTSSTLSSSWKAPAILRHVPADSPYLFASLEPISDALRERMTRGLDRRLAELSAKLEQLRDAPGDHGRAVRAALALRDELRGQSAASWYRALGFDPAGQFVMYGLGVWPVARVGVSDPARLRAVIQKVSQAAGATLQESKYEGRAYWSAGTDKVSIVAAVLDREAVIAVLPTAALPANLPYVLGTKTPAASLATAPVVPELLGRHHLLGFVAAYFDLHRIADLLTSPTAGPLDDLIHAALGPVSPVCRSEWLRVADVSPRIAFGYRRLDDRGFAGSVIFETPASVTQPLGKLRTAAAGVTAEAPEHALFTVAAAVVPEDVQAWLGGVAKELRARPFACPQLAELNKAAEELARGAAGPLPEPLRALRGFAAVLDDAKVMPPAVDGYVVLTGAPGKDAMSALAGAMPFLSSLGLTANGKAVELPLGQLGLPIAAAHIAATSERLAIAAGPQSARRAEAQIAAPLPARSPLFRMSFDAPRLGALLASIGKTGAEGLEGLGDVDLVVDVAADGVVLDIEGTWPASK